MTDEQRDRMLIETHTMTRELRVVVLGTNGKGMIGEIENAKGDRKTIVGRLDHIERNMVTTTACKDVRESDQNRKRSRWLVVKDIVLLLLGGGGAVGAALSLLGAIG